MDRIRSQNGGKDMTSFNPAGHPREAVLTIRRKAFSWMCRTLLTAVTYLLCGTGAGVA